MKAKKKKKKAGSVLHHIRFCPNVYSLLLLLFNCIVLYLLPQETRVFFGYIGLYYYTEYIITFHDSIQFSLVYFIYSVLEILMSIHDSSPLNIPSQDYVLSQ